MQARPIKPLYNGGSNLVSTALSIPAAVPPVSPTAPISTTATQTSQIEPAAPSPASAAVISEAASKSTATTSSVNYLSSPVTIAAGVQPMLTYSVVGAPPKSTTVTVASNQFLPQNAGLPHVNGHYIYHPTPTHIMSGAIPLHPTAVYPVIPPKQLIRSDLKPHIQSASITTLSSELEAVSINEKTGCELSNKAHLFNTSKSTGDSAEKTENNEILLNAINAETS